MKKTIAIILSVVMILSCFCAVSASAASATNLILNGETFTVPTGTSTVTYTLDLTAPDLVENGQFTISYPNNLLSVANVELPNVDGYMLNYTDNLVNEVKFNFSNYKGFNFKSGKTLAKIDFNVIGSGSGEFGLVKEVLCNVDDVSIIEKSTFTESLKGASSVTHKTPALSTKTKSLKPGKTFTLKVKNTTEKVTFKSSKTKIATVSSKGVVTALKKGSANITATLASGKKFTCKVTVSSSPKLSAKTVKVKVNKTKTVKLTGKAKAINNKYTNTKIAKIISNKTATSLKVKGLKKGTTTLKIKVNKNTILKLKVTVTK